MGNFRKFLLDHETFVSGKSFVSLYNDNKMPRILNTVNSEIFA